jgi:hypothetical protein
MARKQATEQVAVRLVRQCGFRTAGVALGLLLAWTLYLDEYGHDPTIRELEGTTDRSNASYSRDLQRFRKAFPGEDTPAGLARALLAMRDFDVRKATVADVAGLPADSLVSV